MTESRAPTSMNSFEKAQQINADPSIYGSFAEIGAGQEVARWFFRAGRASATVAKTISAYDMVFSDAIYGAEENHRYVCEGRLDKMLEREYALIKKRIWEIRGDKSRFFVFADTMASRSSRTDFQGGHGWMGVRFQSEPLGPENDVILHVRMTDHSVLEQQEAVGIIGLNLIYGCFNHHADPVRLIETLRDGLKPHRFEIDMIRFEGPAFQGIDNRLMSLQLVALGLTDAVLIAPSGEVLQPSEALYKKDLLVQRGRFRPYTNLHADMLGSGRSQFLRDPSVKQENLVSLFEITLNNLLSNGRLDITDFLARVEILGHLGHCVLISNYPEYYRLSEFFTKYTSGKVGIIMGVGHLNMIFDKAYYNNLRGGLLQALGCLFHDRVKALIYPAYSLSTTMPGIGAESGTGANAPITASNYQPPLEVQYLYRHLLENHAIEDIAGYDPKVLGINSEEVLKDIQEGRSCWKQQVPAKSIPLIEKRHLFGHKSSMPEKVG